MKLFIAYGLLITILFAVAGTRGYVVANTFSEGSSWGTGGSHGPFGSHGGHIFHHK